jgi:beta-lactamase regulating signal transducer with metallopeptidase domain
VNAPAVFMSMVTVVAAISIVLLLASHGSARYSRNAATRHFVLIVALAGAILIPLVKFAIPFDLALTLPVSRPDSLTFSRNLQEAKLLSREFRWLTTALLYAWGLGTTFLVVQSGLAIGAARKTLRRLSRPHQFVSLDLGALAAKAGLRRSFELRVRRSRRLASPLTWGIFRPLILLPQAAIHWPEERLQAVLLHEMAHIRRNDSLSLLVTRMACALFWFHPLVWRVAREARDAAEISADDVAVGAGIRASSYATELVAIAAEMSGLPGSAWRPVLAITNEAGIETRVRAIVDPGNTRKGLSKRLAGCLILVALSGVIGLAGLEPEFATARKRVATIAERHALPNFEVRESVEPFA